MTLTIRESATHDYVLSCDGKDVATVPERLLVFLVKREGGTCELWPAQGVVPYALSEQAQHLGEVSPF